MSFTIETNNPGQLYMIMNMVSHVLPMANICIKKDGLYISGLDTSHISYIELELDKDYFTRYEMKCDIEKNDITLGISMNELVKILKVSHAVDHLVLNYNTDDDNQLYLSFRGSGIIRTYTLPLFDIENTVYEISRLDYPVELEINSKTLNNLLDSILITETDQLMFKVNQHKLSICSNGDNINVNSNINIQFDNNRSAVTKTKLKLNIKDNTKCKYDTKETIYTVHSCEGSFHNSFDIQRIKQFTKFYNIFPTIHCNIYPQQPLRLDYIINDNGSVLHYYISPKIED